ncbi:MAG TPA: hypothetical protein VMC84_05440 [Methanocella sp.]|uniref:hypothetical protein n=1 Tax=Methanocella sp. TaxID=2052833 RepID=UPI002C8237DB|nr:hypothetical protein [Methanocella sp.]HTY90602.1 hypothetical protein [Methanocella sp.]
MEFVFTKLVGLLSLTGTIVGLVLGGATIMWNVYVGSVFFLLAIVSFITFIGFLYNFIRYAEYEIPYEKVKDGMDEDEEPR